MNGPQVSRTAGNVPTVRLVDHLEERVELLVAGRVGIVPTFGEDLRGGAQIAPCCAHTSQLAGPARRTVAIHH